MSKIITNYARGDISPDLLFTIRDTENREAFGAKQKKLTIEFTDTALDISSSGFLGNLMEDAIEYVIEKENLDNSDDLVQIACDSNAFDYSVSTGEQFFLFW